MEHIWKTTRNESPESKRLTRSTSMVANSCGSTYKIETLEFTTGKITSILFENEDGASIGKNILQIEWLNGDLKVTSTENVQEPILSSTASVADQLIDFMKEYAETSMKELSATDFADVPLKPCKHARVA